jgi:hypothetical protein
MNIPPYIREFGFFDIENIKNYILNKNKNWNSSFNEMNNRTSYFFETKSFPLVEEFIPWNFEEYDEFYPFLKDIISICHYNFGPGRIYKCNFGLVPSKAMIYPHKDIGLPFVFSHRMHLPIVTNKHVYFKIEKNFYNLKEGHLYEINNQKIHSVENKNIEEFNRIHLIFDWMSEEYYRFL